MGKYFSVTVKPTVTASLQHTSAFSAGDILWDFTAFDIPKGAKKLINATVLVRPKGDAGPTHNAFGLSLIFSELSTSLGTINSAPDHTPRNDFLGQATLQSKAFIGGTGTGLDSTNIATFSASTTYAANYNLILSPTEANQPVSTKYTGYDRYYIAGIAGGAFDFISINAIAEDTAAEAAASQVITMDGSGMDVRDHFIDGDVVHIGTSVGSPGADSLVGTVASADSATQITLDDVSPILLVDGDILYNIHPFRIKLDFEG